MSLKKSLQYSQDSTVHIVALLWSRQPLNRGLIPETGKRFFSFPKCIHWLWRTAGLPSMGTTVFFPETVKLVR
jgi:hypothetical protein